MGMFPPRAIVSFSRSYHRLLDPVSLLQQSSSMPKSVKQLKQIHAKLVVSQTISELHVSNTLLSLYAKCGGMKYALLMFDQMPQRNVVTWTSLISAQIHNGSFEKAFELLKGMLELGERPNQYTLSIIIRACIILGSLHSGLQIHGLMIHLGLETDEFAGSSLLDMYFKIGNNLEDAGCVFSGLSNKDRVTWNVMISGFAQAGNSKEVLRLLSEMWEVDELSPDDFTFTSLLKCCRFLSEVKQVHCVALKFGLEVDSVVGSALVDLYGKCNDMDSSLRMLESMEWKDTFVWSSIISGYTRNGRGKEAFFLFKDMCRKGMRPDEHVLSGTLRASVDIGDLKTGIQVHSQMIKNGYQKNCFVASVLLTLYADCSEMAEAEKLFRRIKDRDLVAWNSIILGYARMEEGCDSCIQVFQELRRTTLLKPDAATLIAVLKSCQSRSDLVIGIQIHSLLVKSSLSQKTPVANSVIHMYSECGSVTNAYKAFNDTIEKDEISWSSIIGTFQKNKVELEALRLSKEMMSNGIRLTNYSLPLCIAASSGLAAIDLGKQFHTFIIKMGLHRDVYVGSSVIGMYAKCGNMEESIKAYNEQDEPNTVTLNAMISGFAQHGKALEAIELFNDMEKMGLVPNHVTFLAVLSACSHVGFVEESMCFFNLMGRKYNIKPNSEHYSCLVDVYGRAGRFEEAYKLLENDGSVSAWRTLLGACRNYGDMKIAEKSVGKMIEMNPNDHAPYILLSNMYCGEGKWEEAIKLRQKMAKIGVKKDPGSSWLVH